MVVVSESMAIDGSHEISMTIDYNNGESMKIDFHQWRVNPGAQSCSQCVACEEKDTVEGELRKWTKQKFLNNSIKPLILSVIS